MSCPASTHLMCLWKKTKDPLLWWSKHEGQFLMITHLTRAILDILGSQIKMKIIFYIAGIFIGLCQCWLGGKDLDLIILLINN